MKIDVGLTLWFGVFLLLASFKSADACGAVKNNIFLDENIPKGEILYTLPDGNWSFVSSDPSGYITLEQNNASYFLKAAIVIDSEILKKMIIKVVVLCNQMKTIDVIVSTVNEYSPTFDNTAVTVSIKEDDAKGTAVYNAANNVQDRDFQPLVYRYSAVDHTSSQKPPDGVAAKMFEVTEDGLVKVSGNLDFEKENEYTIDIMVQESPFNATMKLTIKLEDVDDTGPVFIVSNTSTLPEPGIPQIYKSEININYTGELPIIGGSIQAKDTEKNYSVKYSITKANPTIFINYFDIDSSSGKVSLSQKLPADVDASGVLIIKAEEISPNALSSVAILMVSITDKLIKTTTQKTTATAGMNETSGITSFTSTLPTEISSSSVTPGQSQVTTASLNLTSPTETSSSSVIPGQSQVTTASLNITSSTETSSSSSSSSSSPLSSSVTQGQSQTTKDSLKSTSSAGTSSSPFSHSPTIVELTPNGTTVESLNSTLPTETSLSVTSGQSQVTTDSQNITPTITTPTPVTKDAPVSTITTPTPVTKAAPVSGPFSSEEFYAVLGSLIAVIIILIVLLVLFCVWWRKRKENDEEFKETNLSSVKPILGLPDYDSSSKTSSKMNGIENNAADLTDLLENGQLSNSEYDDVSKVVTSPTSNFAENVIYANITNDSVSASSHDVKSDSPSNNILNDDSPVETILSDDSPSDNISNAEFTGNYYSVPELTRDALDDNTDEQMSTADTMEISPVPMTFGDLSKNNSVSFACDLQPLHQDSDNDDDIQPDGLSYVDHIIGGGDDVDDGDEHSSDGTEDDPDSTNKSGETPKPAENNGEEMTWLVADNDGDQLDQEQDKEQQGNDELPPEIQLQLSYNNEIGYAPLLDDSERDSWGLDHERSESIRL